MSLAAAGVVSTVRCLPIVFLFAVACGTSLAPSPTLAGTWAETFSIPGASLVLHVDSGGNGTGTYAIEAGRSGTITVTGTFVNGQVSWLIHYDYGLDRAFTGSLVDAGHITGVFSDTGQTVTFTRT